MTEKVDDIKNSVNMSINPEDAKRVSELRGKSKLSPSNSFLKKKVDNKEEFEKKADEVISITQDKLNKGAKLTSEFWSMIKDTGLKENRGPLKSKFETGVVNDLISYAISVNNDPNEINDSIGSTAIDILLLKALLYQRDLYNDLNYRLTKLEAKEIK